MLEVGAKQSAASSDVVRVPLFSTGNSSGLKVGLLEPRLTGLCLSGGGLGLVGLKEVVRLGVSNFERQLVWGCANGDQMLGMRLE